MMKKCVYPGEQEKCPRFENRSRTDWRCLSWRDRWLGMESNDSICTCHLPVEDSGDGEGERDEHK